MSYYKGQILPLDRARGITHGPEIMPVWHALIVPPQKEKAAKEMLKKRGVFAFYPTREKVHFRNGKKITNVLPSISQVVYARFSQAPQWDVMKARRLITGMYAINGSPIVIPPAIIRQVQGLQAAEEELEAAKMELARIKEGDKIRIGVGPFENFCVEVDSTAQGRLWWNLIIGGKRVSGSSSVDQVVKIT